MKMEKIIDVSTGMVEAAKAGVILRSLAIGSCVVIAAYDSSKKVGAMAHIMLPGRAPRGADDERTRYAADAIDEMINRITKIGANKCDLEVCLVGAGNVLKKQDDTICKDNIESITHLLLQKNMPVKAAALGGTERRSVFLDIENGRISFIEGDEEEKLLWKSSGKTH